MFLSILKVLIALIRPDGTNGNQILHADAGIVKFLGYVDYKPEVMFNRL